MASSIGTNAGILSLLQAAAVVGGLFVVVAVRKIHERVGWGKVQRLCFLVAGIGLVALAVINSQATSPTITLAASLMAIIPIGFALNLDISILNALVQVAAPREARTSVLTYFALIPTLAMPLAQELIGGLSDVTTVSTALYAVGAITLLLIGFGPQRKLRPAFDGLDTTAAPPERFPVSSQVARPDIVTAHARTTSPGTDSVGGSYDDTSIGVIEDEVGPIDDQTLGPDLPDRPEGER